MLDHKGFDQWADEYDASTSQSDEENSYPFAGYSKILKTIYDEVMQTQNAKVLDIGFGTAVLTSALYEKGCVISGIDFSSKMIETAAAKMPEARLYQFDFSKGLPKELENETFDFIVATYSLHHLEDEQKISFIHELQKHLNRGGKILIGDVAFETRKELEECAHKAGDEWDEEEIYFVYDEMKSRFENLSFEKITYCSGILTLSCM